MLKILFAASEVQPLIKTGGLADVSGALPGALKNLKHDIRIILPAYGDVFKTVKRPKLVGEFYIPGIAGNIAIRERRLPQSSVRVLFVDYPAAFSRNGNPYTMPNGESWPDNAARFSLFCKAIVEVAQNRIGLDWQPDVIHCNDWQTGLVPPLLSLEPARPATVFTIHNLAYQGVFDQKTFHSLGIQPQLWSFEALEFHGNMSFIKGGIVFADQITTVSPRYSKEIQTPEFGNGLETLLKFNQSMLSGILNGIDTTVWNSKTDVHIAKHYDQLNIEDKSANKAALQEQFNLPQDKSILLLGTVGRLTAQKGIDLIIELIENSDKLPIQIVLLGSGDPTLEKTLFNLSQKYPKKFQCNIGYNEVLAHQIEAGADAFLMPSRFEPCGLNQLYSLRYGTLPIVTQVGGLADTVIPLSSNLSTLNQANGFGLLKTDFPSLLEQIKFAIKVFNDPAKWRTMVNNAMSSNHSWGNSAKQYLNVYDKALQIKEIATR